MKKYYYCLVEDIPDGGFDIKFHCATLKAMDNYIKDDTAYPEAYIRVIERSVVDCILLCEEMYGHHYR